MRWKSRIVLVTALAHVAICLSEEIATIKYCKDYKVPSSSGDDSTLTLKTPATLTTTGKEVEFKLEKRTKLCWNDTILTDLPKKKGKSPSLGSFTPTGYLKIGFKFYDPEDYCILSDDKNKISATICPVDCTQTPCIPKCCPPDEAWDFKGIKCSHSGEKRWSPIFHHEDTQERLTEEQHDDLRPHYIESKARCARDGSVPYLGRDDFDTGNEPFQKKDIRLLKNGKLLLYTKGKWKQTSSLFCIDGIQNFGDGEYHSGDEKDFIILRFAHCDLNDTSAVFTLDDNGRRLINNIHAGLMLFSCSFLIATIAIYILLWEKQNIHGWTIMSYVVSMLFMYIFLAMFKLFQNSPDGIENIGFCVPNAIFAHFFFMTTFCWLTVINFDIWWKFRDMKPNPMRSKEIKRYVFYALFATGLPIFIIMLGQIIEANECSGTDCPSSSLISPHYGRMSCFLDRAAEGAYLYYPLAALLGFNLVFFFSTSFILYRHYQATKNVRDNSPGNQSMEAVKVFAKLYFVMGITWIFDFISWRVSKSGNEEAMKYFAVFDFINILQAVAIFFIFVFKRQILTQLWNKYPSMRPILLPMKKLPCCQHRSFDIERSKSGRGTDRKRSLTTSRKDSTLSNTRKESFDKSFETVEL